MKNTKSNIAIIAGICLITFSTASHSTEQSDAFSYKVTGSYSPCSKDVLASAFTESATRWLRRYKPSITSQEENTIYMQAKYKKPLDIQLSIKSDIEYEVFVQPASGVRIKQNDAAEITRHIATGLRKELNIAIFKAKCPPPIVEQQHRPTEEQKSEFVIEQKREFTASDHKSYSLTGNGTIKGQAFLRQKGGGVVTCAGNQVSLVPSTPYFHELLYLQLTDLPHTIESEAKNLIKQVTCDAQGNFQFTDIAPNKWIIMTDVEWHVGKDKQGGTLITSIITESNKQTEIFLTNSHVFGMLNPIINELKITPH